MRRGMSDASNRSIQTVLCVGLVALLTCTGLPSVACAEGISEADAHAIGVDAYLYFYPLLTMDITRKQFTNVEAGKEFGKGPMNMFVNVPEYPPADFKGVVRSNFDTLYSIAWLDLTGEPVVVSAPDTSGRYYLLPMLDMWSDVFASPGWRTTGTKAADYVVIPQGWKPELRGEKLIAEYKLPKDAHIISAPTPYVWVIGRTKTDGPQDYDAVHKIQAGYKVTPVSHWGKPPETPNAKIDPSIDMKTPPKTQVDTMSADKYFTYAAELLKLHPPHITDEPIVARMKRIGITPGQSFDFAKLDPAVKKGLESAPKDAQALMKWKIPTLARVANYWSMNTDTMGVYGNYYLKRAMVTQIGLGANLPDDAIYPMNLADESGQPLNGHEQVHDPFREGGRATRERFLVDHALRLRRFPSGQLAQSVRREQLDAVQDEWRRFARPLFPEREPRQRQGGQLAAGAEGSVQRVDATLCSEVGRTDRQMESAARGEDGRAVGHGGAMRSNAADKLTARNPQSLIDGSWELPSVVKEVK